MLEQNNEKKPKKYAGILAHPTSFPSPYGIGDLGPGAYQFIDFLAASGLNLWQVLPLGHTGFGDSPYQPFSAFAGQPLIMISTTSERRSYFWTRTSQLCLTGILRRSTMEHL